MDGATEPTKDTAPAAPDKAAKLAADVAAVADSVDAHIKKLEATIADHPTVVGVALTNLRTVAACLRGHLRSVQPKQTTPPPATPPAA